MHTVTMDVAKLLEDTDNILSAIQPKPQTSTLEKTEEKVNPLLVNLGDMDHQMLVTWYVQKKWMEDHYPTFKETASRFNTTVEEILLRLDDLNEALDTRGLPPVERPVPKTPLQRRQAKEPKPEKIFDPRFILACDLICDTYNKVSRTKKLQSAGLTTRHWNAFLEDEDYRKYYKMRVDRSWGHIEELSKEALQKNVEAGDLQSVKYVHEYTGLYRPNQQTLLNLGVLIGRLMEILPKYLTTQQLSNVAEEFEGVVALELGTGQLENAS